MKRLLPKSYSNTSKGFTLIELMVVIAIIAILSVVGVTVFSTVQKNARDSRRRADIDSIANALESNKTVGSQTYPALAAGFFASGSEPTDSVNGIAEYTIAWKTTAGAAPTKPTVWVNTSNNPPVQVGGNPGGWSTALDATVALTTAPPVGTYSWTVCALLESGTNPTNIYCDSSAQ